MAAQQYTSSLPEEIPPSRTAYVLTTSEGRDKLFKMLQYALTLWTWTLRQPGLLPSAVVNSTTGSVSNTAASVAAANATALQLEGNIRTLRNGRALFRLGRWIVSLFHWRRLFLQFAHIAKTGSVSNARGSGGKVKKVDEEDSTTTNRRRASVLSRSILTLMSILLLVRTTLSIFRSSTRDLVFLTRKRLFGFTPELLSRRTVQSLERAQDYCWLIVSSSQLCLSLYRLLDSNWLPALSYMRCRCDPETTPAHRYASMDRFLFPDPDFDVGCPLPMSEEFLKAVPPGEMPILCAECGMIFSVESGCLNKGDNKSTRQQQQQKRNVKKGSPSLTSPPPISPERIQAVSEEGPTSPQPQQQHPLPFSIVASHDDEGEGEGEDDDEEDDPLLIMGMGVRQPTLTNVLTGGMDRDCEFSRRGEGRRLGADASTGDEDNHHHHHHHLVIPRALRLLSEAWYILNSHQNLKFTLLQMLKDLCEMWLAYRYLTRKADAARLLDTALCGLLSAFLSVHRVWVTA